jgi:hypothetical protein
MRHDCGVEIAAWVESADVDMIRRRSGRSLFGHFRNVVVQLLLTDPYNFEVVEYLGSGALMRRNILLDFAQHQALAGIVRANENGDPLRRNAERLSKLGEF